MNVTGVLELPYLEEGLAVLEEKLLVASRAGDAFLDGVTSHLISAGGKRLRPTLSLASASLVPGYEGPSADTIQGGVAVELVHLASLYHDDVMDEATMRRNVQSVNARWGNLVAIVAGDFLLARSAELAAELGAEIAGLLANTLGRLCQGQVAEVQTAFMVNRTEDQYLQAIAGKTASLMATACRIGALTAGVDRDQVDMLTSYGERFGMAFQVRDDILDVVASEHELGKPPGQDLAEGIYTLPVLRALKDPALSSELRPLLGQPLADPERDKAREIVAGSNGVSWAVEIGKRFALEAAERAEALPASMAKTGLVNLAMWLADSIPS